MRSSVVEEQLRWADAIVMVYSITDADSFRQLKNTSTKLMEKAMDLEERELRYARGFHFNSLCVISKMQLAT